MCNQEMLLNLHMISHLNILMELEKKFPRKITSIDGIAEANNYKDLENILISKKILIND